MDTAEQAEGGEGSKTHSPPTYSTNVPLAAKYFTIDCREMPATQCCPAIDSRDDETVLRFSFPASCSFYATARPPQPYTLPLAHVYIVNRPFTKLTRLSTFVVENLLSPLFLQV